MGQMGNMLSVKSVAAIVITVIVIIAGVVSAWYFLQIAPSSPVIKIGVMRNKLIQGQGMEEGAVLAVEEINGNGGVLVNRTTGERRNIVLYFGDEGTEPTTGKAEIERLITVESVDFILGGFRTEIVYPMREVAMDYKKIFIITGASTTELLNCFGSLTVETPCEKCVKCDYERYKYAFRVMPPNSSLLFGGALVPFIKGHVLPDILGGTEESPVKIAGVIEALTWTDLLDWYFTEVPTLVTGLKGRIVYYARPSATETDFTAILTKIRDSGAELIIHVFSGEAGVAFIKQWGEMQIPAIPIGVNVLGQETDHWTKTGGKCEYEAFLSSPVRANITEKTIPFWEAYVERWGHDPVYTSFGTYDAVYLLKEAIEEAEALDSDTIVAEMENTDRISLSGRFKFTSTHDVLVDPSYTVDPTGRYHWVTTKYVQPLIVQWRSPGERVVVFPFNQMYTVDLQLPPWMSTP